MNQALSDRQSVRKHEMRQPSLLRWRPAACCVCRNDSLSVIWPWICQDQAFQTNPQQTQSQLSATDLRAGPNMAAAVAEAPAQVAGLDANRGWMSVEVGCRGSLGMGWAR